MADGRGLRVLIERRRSQDRRPNRLYNLPAPTLGASMRTRASTRRNVSRAAALNPGEPFLFGQPKLRLMTAATFGSFSPAAAIAVSFGASAANHLRPGRQRDITVR
jgi:hypothetical protein